MMNFTRRILPALVATVGIAGCGLMCDRYCSREQNRCQQYYCNPAPQQQCCPAPTTGYYQPNAQVYPRPVDNCQPVAYCQ